MSVKTAGAIVTDVQVREVSPQTYLGKRFSTTTTDVGRVVPPLFQQLFGVLAKAGIPPGGPPFLIATPPQGGLMDVEIGVPVTGTPGPIEGLPTGILPAGLVAVVRFVGPYGDLHRVYPHLMEWIAANGYVSAGPPRETYLTGPDDVPSPDEHVTEVIWPIRRA